MILSRFYLQNFIITFEGKKMKQSKLFTKREKEREEEELKEKKYNEAVERKKDYRRHIKMRGVENLKPKEHN